MKSLLEGLLDDNIFNDIDNEVVGDWLKKNASGQYKTMQLKDGTIKVWGTMIIKKAQTIPPLRISFLEGNLYIENAQIETLDGIFNPGYANKIRGNISITGCPKLHNISALPAMLDGDVSISDCKSLRSLDGVRCLAGEVSIMRCGKRFSKAAVQKAFPSSVTIYCSEDDELPNIMESFQDPILIRLYDQLRNAKMKYHMGDMFGTHLQLDKIAPSMRETFKMPADEAKMKKAINAIIIRGGVDGFFVTEDFDGNFKYFYDRFGNEYNLTAKNKWEQHGYPLKVSEIRQSMSSSDWHMSNIKFVHVWKPVDVRNDSIQGERRLSREGMVTNDKQYLKTLLREQRDRYKAAVAKIKAARKSDVYKNKVAEVDKIMERFSKFMNKLIADNSWASSIGYKASLVFDSIRLGYVRGRSLQQYGVIYAFQHWANNVVRTLAGEANTWTKIDSTELDNAIAWADKELSGVGC